MRKKILIVDDDEKNRKLLRVVLQNAGHDTLEAEDGVQSIKLAKESIPALILMDMRMPVMDGAAATRILKSDPSTSHIPVIAITASAMRGDHERIVSEAGCDDYISKPVEIKSFLETIKKYLGG